MRTISGEVFFGEQEIGTFTVDSNDQIIVENQDGIRWDASRALQWALENGETLLFRPLEATVTNE